MEDLRTRDKTAHRFADAEARACLVRFGWKRLALSQLFEAMLWPFVYLRGLRSHGAPKEPTNILVVEFWNLGDLVMITPFLKNLRRHYPKSRICFLGSPRMAPLLKGQELVDELITVRVPWAQHMSRRKKYLSRDWVDFVRCIRELRARQFDLGFTGRADVRENFLLWAAGIERRVGYGFGRGASFLTEVVTPDLAEPHFSHRWLHMLEHLGKPVLDRKPELQLTTEEKRSAREFLNGLGVKETHVVVGVHSGARNRVRQWGEDRFLEVARRLETEFHVKVLWFREPEAKQPAVVLPTGYIPLQLSLRAFLGVVSKCQLFICNDTGPMHLASALNVPVVAIFGPTMPAWFSPKGDHSRIVIHEGVWCRPCFDYCIFDQPYCLRAVSIDSVYETAAEVLRGMRGRGESNNRKDKTLEPLGIGAGANPPGD